MTDPTKMELSKDISKQVTINEIFSINKMINDEDYNNLSHIIHQICLACKVISNKIKRAGIEDLYGTTSVTNFHGEEVKTLDVLSNTLFINCLKKNDQVAGLISEEDTQIITVNENGKYIIAFDPLDGSSNIDANVNIGSIFGIYKRVSDVGPLVEEDYLRPGKDMLLAGYCLYGCSTMIVIAYQGQVNGFSLDESFGEYILTHPNIKIKNPGLIYSVNEGNFDSWEDNLKELVNYLKTNTKEKKAYSGRYIGSMVADIHRTLLYGGLFMYPASKNATNGKLRYLYEVAPMSFIIKMAGGDSIIAYKEDALEYKPKNIHERVPIFQGSINCIEEVTKFMQ